MMWTAYKKEIIEKSEVEAEFLKLHYQNSFEIQNPKNEEPEKNSVHFENEESQQMNNNIENDENQNYFAQDEDDWPVQVSLSFKVLNCNFKFVKF